jgi:hypothetical protein
MSDPKRGPVLARQQLDARSSSRDGDVRGLLEAARQWARQSGLPVPTHGPVPPGVVAQYRRRQTWE